MFTSGLLAISLICVYITQSWSVLFCQISFEIVKCEFMQGTWIWSLGQEDPLEKGMVIHYSILPWRIPWTEEPGGLESMESQTVGQDWAQHTHSHTRVTEEGGLWLLEQRWGDRNGHVKPRRRCEYSTVSWRFTHRVWRKRAGWKSKKGPMCSMSWSAVPKGSLNCGQSKVLKSRRSAQGEPKTQDFPTNQLLKRSSVNFNLFTTVMHNSKLSAAQGSSTTEWKTNQVSSKIQTLNS